ncbi:hypothetical protein TNCT_229481 [Trichonephila clavata]|uniref:Uncharacterized protein n=1 Tax=Trichonephila clavata TaxID=2740835 RepID=A0A8X6HSV1_TRICU|nr:hypothetical protein TNCT_729861 [Trichonephila clavata]GFR29507.1 hypothetical protein TNCT_229481 [Trichonephila clavata]
MTEEEFSYGEFSPHTPTSSDEERFDRLRSERFHTVEKLPRTIGVLSATCLGYSITNGIQVISNNRIDGGQLERDVEQLKIDRLFIVDSDFLLPFEHPRVIYLEPLENFPPCIMCREKNCHRWRVIACGLQRLVQYRVHLINH